MTTDPARPNLIGMGSAEMQALAEFWHEPSFRGRQLYEWLYARRESDIAAMKNLGKAMQSQLAVTFNVALPQLITKRTGSDGSSKLLFGLSDGERVESVYIPEGKRRTLCISSQVGCLVGCKFCATGLMGFRRNCESGEIVGQLMAAERLLDVRFTNVVMMGMGEPMLNRRAVFKAAEIMTDPDGLGVTRRKFTISTVGWVPGIRALAKSGLGVRLAISLNGTTDEERRRIMPLMARFTLKEILAAGAEYAKVSGEPVSLSYLLMKGVNDGEDDAKRLIALSRSLPSKVNLMEYNSVGSEFDRLEKSGVEQFASWLLKAGLTVTLRTSRGRDVGGACGQLAADYAPGSGKILEQVSRGEAELAEIQNP